MRMRDRLIRFMQGRYGIDALSKFLVWVGIGVLLLSNIFRTGFLHYVGLLIVLYSYYRIFSKAYEKRRKENAWFLDKTRGIRALTIGVVQDRKRNKGYRIYSCPSCKQKIRIPKGKGRIVISCPKCKNQFEKKS